MVSHVNHTSEIARLREQIAREHQAASWALTGPALGTAQHRFITRRMERIGACQERLAALVGEQASLAMVVEILEGSPAQQRSQEPCERPCSGQAVASITGAAETPGSARRRS